MPASFNESLKVLEAQLGKTAFGTRTNTYIGLSSTAPTNGNPPTTITEPSGGSYARVTASAATWGSATVVSGTTPTITNAAVITFPTASADWASGANLTHAVIYDAATAGNVIGYGTLTVPKNVLSGDTASIAIGGITVTLT